MASQWQRRDRTICHAIFSYVCSVHYTNPIHIYTRVLYNAQKGGGNRRRHRKTDMIPRTKPRRLHAFGFV